MFLVSKEYQLNSNILLKSTNLEVVMLKGMASGHNKDRIKDNNMDLQKKCY